MNEQKNSEVRTINTANMRVDLTYQQVLQVKRVERIVNNFDRKIVNRPKVSFRDGVFWIFNGQHTVAALKIIDGGGKDIDIECEVFYGLTQAEEARLFVLQEGEHQPVKIGAKTRALYNTGDAEAVDFVHAIEEVGLSVDFDSSNSTKHNTVNCISTLLTAKKHLPRDQFVSMLSLIRDTWGGSPSSLRKEIVGAMAKFYGVYHDDISRKVFISALGKVDPLRIIREGTLIGTHSATTYARIIAGIYNKGRSANRLPDKL